MSLRVYPPKYIMVHHSLTADGASVSWAAIERYHRETQKWADIGYHAGIEIVNDHAPGADGWLDRASYQALIGRPEDQVAAACKEGDMNRLALHVCCVGNFDIAAPPAMLLDRLCDRVLRPWMHRYGIDADHIKAHRDYATYKSCPGTLFDMDALRRMVS